MYFLRWNHYKITAQDNCKVTRTKWAWQIRPTPQKEGNELSESNSTVTDYEISGLNCVL